MHSSLLNSLLNDTNSNEVRSNIIIYKILFFLSFRKEKGKKKQKLKRVICAARVHFLVLFSSFDNFGFGRAKAKRKVQIFLSWQCIACIASLTHTTLIVMLYFRACNACDSDSAA